ncbi:MAG TPA: malonyl-CoA synthase [Devosia sp.]|nr:malonyl-CoA synthase [Devosia sp.]
MTNPLYDALIGRHRGNTKTFLELADSEDLSFDAFVDLAARIATVLLDHGVNPGDRVAVQAPKTPEVLATYAACLQIGAIFLPLNTAYTAAEVEYFLTDATPRLFIVATTAEVACKPLCARLGIGLLTLGATRDGTLVTASTRAAPHREVVPRDPEDLAAILYTSGTTGRSKGAMLTQRNLLSNAEALVEIWRFTTDDVLIHALPIFHTHGLFVASNVMLLVGGTMLFQAGFNADAVLDAIPRASVLMGVPTFYTRLLGSERLTRSHVEHMRLFISGSAPLLAETHVEFEARTGQRILERYGMTETSMTTSNPYDGERRAGTVGFPLPGVTVRVADKDGVQLPPGETGGLEVKGPNVFKGYWKMPEKTASEFRSDGHFITGDMARIDEGGYVQIVGRYNDMIISGGLNVYPKEIETEIDAVPGVLESAVVGVPHPDFGEAIVAVMVVDSGFDMAGVESRLETRLARFKRPRHYAIVPELPRNAMGKVQKAELREAHKHQFTRPRDART